MDKSGRYLIVLPTYNERQNVSFIAQVLENCPAADVLVVDDSSPDGTADAVRALMDGQSRIQLLERPEKMGLGSAYVLGFTQAIEQGYAGVFTMDADRSHDPAVLPAMLEAFASADLVIGSRYTAGGSSNQPLARKVNSSVANILARMMLDLSVRDCTSGFRLYSTQVLYELGLAQLQSRGYSMLVELLVKVVEQNGRVAEVPIAFLDRRAGNSKMGMHEVWESLRTIARLRRGRFGNIRTRLANKLFALLVRSAP